MDGFWNEKQHWEKKKDTIPSLGKYDKRLLSDSDLSDSDSVRLKILSSYFEKLLEFKPIEVSRAIMLQSTGGDVEEINRLNLPYNGKDMFELIIEGRSASLKFIDTDDPNILLELGIVLKM